MTSTSRMLLLMLLLLLLSLQSSDGARILILVLSMNSHVMLFSNLGIELARLGHDVRLVAPSNARVPDFARPYLHRRPRDGQSADDGDSFAATRFNFTTFDVGRETSYANSFEYNNAIISGALANSAIRRLILTTPPAKKVIDEFELEAEVLVGSAADMDDIRRGGFEFVITYPAKNLLAVALDLGVPYAIMSIVYVPSFYRFPRLPSFAPTPMVSTSDRLTFGERLSGLLLQLFFEASWRFENKMIQVDGRKLPNGADELSSSFSISYLDALEKSSAWFISEDPAVSYALPSMPNIVQVGDIMSGRPGKGLPVDLERFVADAEVIIVVSFGSYIDYVPEEVSTKFCDTFRGLREGVRVVWKVKGNACSEVEHVQTVSWIPQNDLLADARVRLLITHGGLNSLVEAVYHAKPVIVFPLYTDQTINAQVVASKGYGRRATIGDFTADSLATDIEAVLTDRKYSDNARRESAMMRARRDSAADRVSHMVEHVIKYGDSHLRTGAFELNTVQFWMMDVFAMIYGTVLIGAFAGLVAFRFLCRKMLSCWRKGRKNKSD